MAVTRILSGIQPTGIPHLGNYFGAISRWIKITNDKLITIPCTNEENNIDETNQTSLICDESIFCIVDVHAYSSLSNIVGQQLYDNILMTTASLLSLGLDPEKCILYRQSDLFEHNYLHCVLDNFVTTNRLTHMTQYKDRSRTAKTALNSLLNYPVLQAADILLYRAHYVPVGEDQTQHVELTRDIAKKFNTSVGCQLFPLPQVLLHDSIYARRLRSLRDPSKKMSKSDPNPRSFIQVIDGPDLIVEKCKKALTDNISAVYYDHHGRPAVSNLMTIYHLVTGASFEEIEENFKNVETASFKLDLAQVIIEKFSSAREEFKRISKDRGYLEGILKAGAVKARPRAMETVSRVKNLMGSYRLE